MSIAAIICSVTALIRCEPITFTDSWLSWAIGISVTLTSIGVVVILGYQIYNSVTLDKRMKEMFDERTNKVKEDLADIAQVESFPKLEGRQMIMVLAPKKKK